MVKEISVFHLHLFFGVGRVLMLGRIFAATLPTCTYYRIFSHCVRIKFYHSGSSYKFQQIINVIRFKSLRLTFQSIFFFPFMLLNLMNAASVPIT